MHGAKYNKCLRGWMHNFLESSTRSLVESSNVASIITNADGDIRYINVAARELLGVPSGQWDGCRLSEFLEGAGDRWLATWLTTLCCGESVPEQAFNYGCEDRSLVLMLGSHALFIDGKCAGVIWSLRPHGGKLSPGSGETLRFHHYQALFYSAALPQFVMDIRAVYFWICEHELYTREKLDALLLTRPELLEEVRGNINLVEINEAARNLLGCQRIDTLAGKMQTLATESQILQAVLIAIAVYQGKHQLEYAYDYVDAGGRHYNLLALCSLPSAANVDHGVLVSSVDVTELTDIQADLRARERFLSATLRAVPDLLMVFDYEERRPLFMSEAVGCHLGYDWDYIDSLGDRFIPTLVHAGDLVPAAEFTDYLSRLARGEIIERPLRMRHANGDWKPFSSRTASLEASNGRCRIGVIVARDVTEQLQVRERIDQQERRYKLLAENFSDIICTTDENLNITYISPSVERLLGYDLEQVDPKRLPVLRNHPLFKVMYTPLSRHVAKARRERRHPQIQAMDYVRVFEVDVPHQNGSVISLEVQCSLLWDEPNGLQGLLLVCRDVTQRAQLEADRRLAAKVFENNLQAIFITNKEGCISQINRAFTELTGYTSEDALGARASLLSPRTHQVSFTGVIKPILDRTGFWQGELRVREKDGMEIATAVGITSVTDKQGESLGYITAFTDITERKNADDRIRRLAFYDPLTGLPNRILFMERLNHELQQARRLSSQVALLFIDLDRFKSVNDSMGHAAGDQLLGKIAQRLGSCVRDNDSLARMGGDEFTIILGDLGDRSRAIAASVSVVKKVMAALDDPFILRGQEVFLSASIGVAVYPQDGDDASTLLQHADVAMYNAKKAGKNTFQFYIEAMNARALEKLELQNGLYKATVNHEFRVLYQPIIALASGAIIGVETLLRWNHPIRGPIEPAEFVPAAEESGLIVRIGEWVLKEACQQMACWLSEGCGLEWIAVNISARQFAEGNLVRHVVSALEESALPARYLELELTESILMDDMSYTLEMLRDLKGMGVDLAIDDFGTGYSSLSYLKQFPIDRLKIDRTFVKCLPDDEEDQRITQAIIAIAHSFNLAVVAEGVERQEQVEFLSQHGCEAVQGYLFGRPMGADEFGLLLRERALKTPQVS